MRPTLRGVGVLLVAVAAALVGSQFGQPGLGAIAAPLFVALVGATAQLSLTGTPTVERSSLRPGFVGESHTSSLTVGGSGVARLTDDRPDGVSGIATVRRSLPATVDYEIRYEQRGDHQLGPVTVTLTDTLGLMLTRTTVEATDSVLVYPPVYRLGGPDAFLRTVTPDTEDQQTFDRLREYAPGDSMRDIHWKSSAKRDELFVTEFDDRTGDRGLLVATRAKAGCDDEMAAAAATVVVGALQHGFAIELSTPGGTVPRGYGESQRTRLLETLARATHGQSGREDEADVLISATQYGVTITVDGQTQPFEAVTTSRQNPRVSEVES